MIGEIVPEADAPILLILAGPNGAGKSTAAAVFIRLTGVEEFVNADEIAKGLSAFHPENVALSAGRIALERMEELGQGRKSFAIETTLAARSYLVTIKKLQASGYRVHLVFFWLPSADMAVERVAHRVRSGGHHIEEPVIRRRYQAGIDNFFSLYRTAVDEWTVCDGSALQGTVVIASGRGDVVHSLQVPSLWKAVQDGHARKP